MLGVATALRFAAWPLTRPELPPAERAPAGAETSAIRVSGESLSNVIVARDAFRIGRRPASVAYDPITTGQPIAPPPPKPVLVLDGIVAGAEPSAVVEGLPGVDGPRVVRVGDVFVGLTIKRIDGTDVRIVGMDTVWVLTVRRVGP